ncbi:MAG TPA: ThiF family adenylyltransferase [Flavobacteriales bacterium]|nr:ThiF family adenylyltransferase [Flavobacteriales bacterium]
MSSPTKEERSARLVIIGVGGTGCALVPLVASLPLTSITLVDGDTIEPVNLPRQPLYGPSDVGRMKVDVAAERLTYLSPTIPIAAMRMFIDANNIEDLVSQHDIIADCTDDLNARKLIEATCERHSTALVSGAVHGRQVQVMTLHADGPDAGSHTLRFFFPQKSGSEQDGCDMRAVPPSVTAFAAALMYDRVAALLNNDRSHNNMLDLIDTSTGHWMRLAPPETEPQGELLADRTAPALR